MTRPGHPKGMCDDDIGQCAHTLTFILNSQDIGGGVGKGTIQSLKELQNPDFNLL